MGRKPIRSQLIGRPVRSIALTGAASILSVGLGLLSVASTAIAAELSAWRYDSQTRSLNLALPEGVMPTVSVIAP